MKTLYTILLLCCILGCTQLTPKTFTVEIINRYTPIKDQGRNQICWAYAMLSTIETEHLMRGDSVHLSPAYITYMLKYEKKAPKSNRGMGSTLLNMIQKYGIVQYDDYPKLDTVIPHTIKFLGEEYTPIEFANIVCLADDYIALTTTNKYPYGQWIELETPDNWEHNQFLNVHTDTLLYHTEQAIRRGHGVCWEGDTSEYGFSFSKGVAQLSLLNGSTTDDHAMAIIGIAHSENGEKYFIMKNSWGTNNPYNGLMYMSFDYFRQKTIAIYMTHTGWDN